MSTGPRREQGEVLKGWAGEAGSTHPYGNNVPCSRQSSDTWRTGNDWLLPGCVFPRDQIKRLQGKIFQSLQQSEERTFVGQKEVTTGGVGGQGGGPIDGREILLRGRTSTAWLPLQPARRTETEQDNVQDHLSTAVMELPG